MGFWRDLLSRSLRPRGLKSGMPTDDVFVPFVEVFATSWIEIGLKMWPMRTILVEVFATSWIEMSIGMEVPPRDAVEVFATSWIEIHRLLTPRK